MNEYSVLTTIFNLLQGDKMAVILVLVLIGVGFLLYKFFNTISTTLKEVLIKQSETKEEVIRLSEKVEKQEEITDLKLTEISRRIERLEDKQK